MSCRSLVQSASFSSAAGAFLSFSSSLLLLSAPASLPAPLFFSSLSQLSWRDSCSAAEISRCSSRERVAAACSSARESGCCEALVLRRAAEAESAILSNTATEAAAQSRQRADTGKHCIARCVSRLWSVAHLCGGHGSCAGCARDRTMAALPAEAERETSAAHTVLLCRAVKIELFRT